MYIFFSSGNHRRWRCSFIQHKNRYMFMKCHKSKHLYHINLQWIFFFISLYKCTCFSFTISRTMILKISHDFYLSSHRIIWQCDHMIPQDRPRFRLLCPYDTNLVNLSTGFIIDSRLLKVILIWIEILVFKSVQNSALNLRNIDL